MAIFKNEKSNWLGIIVNPIGYLANHKPIEESARKYYDSSRPSINPETVTELSLKIYRQKWIDSCASNLKSGDVGYSKTNAAQACAAKFDNDPVMLTVQEQMDQQAIDEKAAVQASTEKNTKVIVGLVGAFLLVSILLYLFLS